MVGIPNLYEVKGALANIWRAGQFEGLAQVNQLKLMGITRIVKLNTDTEGSDAEAEGLGIEVKRFPIDWIHQMFGPVEDTLNQALAAIAPNTVVHCELGENRTGALIGLYRIRVCGWSKKEAEKEMDQHNWNTSFPALRIWFWKLKSRSASATP